MQIIAQQLQSEAWENKRALPDDAEMHNDTDAGQTPQIGKT